MNIKTKTAANTRGLIDKLVKKVRARAERAVEHARPKIAAAISSRVASEAGRKSKTVVNAYREALQDPDAIKVTNTGVSVKLKGFARALEDGAPPYDLKAKLLARARKSSPKSGPYVDVPLARGRQVQESGPRKRVGKSFKGRSSKVPIRRLSASSSGWIHPGYKGLHLLKKLVPAMKEDIRGIMRDSLRATRSR